MRTRIAETIVRNLFQGDQSYMPDALACADDILKSPEAGKIRKALDQVNGIIESTYAHDETGERIDETDPEFSSADIVEFVMEVEGVVGEAIEAIGGIEGTTTMPVEEGTTVNELRSQAAKYRELMDLRRRLSDAGESVESLDDDIDELLNETMLLTQSLLKDAPADSVDEPLRRIHVGVVCRNASGSPDVVFYFVEASESSIKDGYHLDSAIEMAGEDDYETPMIAFDENDALYSRLVVHIVPSSDKE